MKKIGMLIITGMLALSLTGCGDPCKENIVTTLGDKIATLGKKGLEKESILAQRKADRAVACAKQKTAEMKKSIGL